MGCATTCAEVEELVDDYLEGRMIVVERWRYLLHLLGCRRCREQVATRGSRGANPAGLRRRRIS